MKAAAAAATAAPGSSRLCGLHSTRRPSLQQQLANSAFESCHFSGSHKTTSSSTTTTIMNSSSTQHTPPTAPDRYSHLLQLSPLQQPLLHPSSNLFAFLTAIRNHLAPTATHPYPNSSSSSSSSSVIPEYCKTPVPEQVQRRFISALAESCLPGSAACSYITDLPAEMLLAPAVICHLGHTSGACCMDVSPATFSVEVLLAAAERSCSKTPPPPPAAAAVTAVTACQAHHGSHPQGCRYIIGHSEHTKELLLLVGTPLRCDSCSCSSSSSSSSGGSSWLVWDVIDPSGCFEHVRDSLNAAGISCHYHGLETFFQYEPGSSCCHVLLLLLGHASKLINSSSPSTLQMSYAALLGTQQEPDLAVSCFAQLVLEGSVVVGLCGLAMHGSGSSSSSSSGEDGVCGVPAAVIEALRQLLQLTPAFSSSSSSSRNAPSRAATAAAAAATVAAPVAATFGLLTGPVVAVTAAAAAITPPPLHPLLPADGYQQQQHPQQQQQQQQQQQEAADRPAAANAWSAGVLHSTAPSQLPAAKNFPAKNFSQAAQQSAGQKRQQRLLGQGQGSKWPWQQQQLQQPPPLLQQQQPQQQQQQQQQGGRGWQQLLAPRPAWPWSGTNPSSAGADNATVAASFKQQHQHQQGLQAKKRPSLLSRYTTRRY
uniref:Uncharacterized protein n=1 Tax=Tetradesmus obliquus TaxID=3088 RepID=A0A383VP09_TETOB|eukprot:jgi/Sobl393_1/5652/SZX67258.1